LRNVHGSYQQAVAVAVAVAVALPNGLSQFHTPANSLPLGYGKTDKRVTKESP